MEERDRDTLTGSLRDNNLDPLMIDWAKKGLSQFLGRDAPLVVNLEPALPVEQELIPTLFSDKTNDIDFSKIMNNKTGASIQTSTKEIEAEKQKTEHKPLTIKDVKDHGSLLNYCSQQKNLIEEQRIQVVKRVTEAYNEENKSAIAIFRARMLAIANYLTWLDIECLNNISVKFAENSSETYHSSCDRIFYAHLTNSTGLVISEDEVGVYTVNAFRARAEKGETEENKAAPSGFKIESETAVFHRETRPETLYLNIQGLLSASEEKWTQAEAIVREWEPEGDESEYEGDNW